MLAEVTAQIRKDIPRLMELKEGCILMKRDTKYNPVYRKIVFTYNNTYYIPSKCFGLKVIEFSKENIDKDYEIIGHEIMLNDVLEWLNYIIYEECIPISDLGYSGMVKQFYVKGDDGSIIFEILDLKNPDLGLDIIRYGVWDLSSIYLKDQSERVIKFLYNLIKK